MPALINKLIVNKYRQWNWSRLCSVTLFINDALKPFFFYFFIAYDDRFFFKILSFHFNFMNIRFYSLYNENALKSCSQFWMENNCNSWFLYFEIFHGHDNTSFANKVLLVAIAELQVSRLHDFLSRRGVAAFLPRSLTTMYLTINFSHWQVYVYPRNTLVTSYIWRHACALTE